MRDVTRRPVALAPAGAAGASGADDGERVDLTIVRPLLHHRRADIHAYVRAQGLTPIEDPSNQGRDYRRNVLRLDVLPPLEAAVPGAAGAIARAAGLLADDADLLDALATDAESKLVTIIDSVAVLDRAGFRRAHLALQRRIVARIVIRLGGESGPPSAERVDALCRAAGGQVGRRIEFGGGLVGAIYYQQVMIGQSADIARATERAIRQTLPFAAGPLVLPLASGQQIDLGAGWVLRIEGPAASKDWELRTRRAGDRLRRGDGRHVRLQDWLVNRKVPAAVRDRLFLLAQGEVVRWVVGLGETRFEDQQSGVVALLTRAGEESGPR
jgi:tRNA(Ile)-lysidine synthase